MLTVLIPTYNHVCVDLVQELVRQISILDIKAEVVVVDDGSTDMNVVSANSAIETLPFCRYVVNPNNLGIAKTRNVLMDSAKYDLMLFLDSDVFPVNDDFLLRYIRAAQDADVVAGGLDYRRGGDAVVNPLRLEYGIHNEVVSVRKRSKHPYEAFKSSSFLIHRKVADQVRFDESFDRYGHEDTRYGASLKDANLSIKHIEAPVYHDDSDTAEQFLAKTRVAIQSLSMHSNELAGSSRLLRLYNTISVFHATNLVYSIFRHFRSTMESNLLGEKPSMFILKVYKISYLCGVMRLDSGRV